MTKPTLIVDAYWRTIDELFSASTWKSLNEGYDVVWGRDAPIPGELLASALPTAFAYVAAEPRVDAGTLERSKNLRVIGEVSGHFPATIDYEACKARDIEVLSCAPGFRQSVAEMGVAMAMAMGRGLVREHEAFRRGDEQWLDDCAGEDFTLIGADIGFVGYGSIAREIHRMLTPFGPSVRCFDPWLPEQAARSAGVTPVDLTTLMTLSRCLFVTAAPTRDNYQMVSREHLAGLSRGALVVLISRSHLVDFDALVDEASSGRIKAAIDVFPSEPVAADHRVRTASNVVLSPHRAAAVEGGRRLIGDLLLKDLDLIRAGRDPANLNRARNLDVDALAGVGDAKAVEAMAERR